MSTLELIGLSMLFAGTSGALVFVVLYALLASWWRTREGWHVMMLTLGLAAFGLTTLLRQAVGEWSGYELTVSAIYAVIALDLWFQVWLLLTAKRRRGTDRKKRPANQQADRRRL